MLRKTRRVVAADYSTRSNLWLITISTTPIIRLISDASLHRWKNVTYEYKKKFQVDRRRYKTTLSCPQPGILSRQWAWNRQTRRCYPSSHAGDVLYGTSFHQRVFWVNEASSISFGQRVTRWRYSKTTGPLIVKTVSCQATTRPSITVNCLPIRYTIFAQVFWWL